jgi:hypothetical protein
MNITVEQLSNTGVAAIMKGKCTNPPKGFLTLDQAEVYLKRTGRCTVISDGSRMFLTDDHIYGGKVLPSQFVPCTGGTDNMSVKDYLARQYKDRILLGSLDEVVSYVNSNY